MGAIKKWIGTAGPVIVWLAGFLVPSISAYAAAHPSATASVLLAAIVAAHNATAPKDANLK